MNRARVATVLAVAATVTLLVPATAPAATTAAAPTCRSVSAFGVGKGLDDGSTAAVVFGDPIVTGTTRGRFTPTGVDGSVVSLSGTVDLRLVRGDLRTEVVGTFDTATGRFSVSTTSITGTRRLADATGELVLAGTQDPEGRFTETVRGTICGAR